MLRVAHQEHHSASDVHTESDWRGFDQWLPRTSCKLHKVICVLHICYLSASSSLTFWIWFPTSILLSYRFQTLTLSFPLSCGHPCPCHLFHCFPHMETKGGRDREREMVLQRISGGEKHRTFICRHF